MTGYYLMHRGWMENDLFRWQRTEPFDTRSAWVWLIEHAQYEPATALIAGKPVELQRGQLSYSYRYLARAWGWSEARVRRYCVAAASLQMLRCVSDAGQAVITICNYDKYQVVPRDGDAPSDALSTQRRRSGDANIKEGNKGKESSTYGSKDPSVEGSPRGSRLPRDLDEIPPDWAEAAAKARSKAGLPELGLAIEWEKFKNHWASKAGQAARKTDWKKTWINWALGATPPWTRSANGGSAAGRYDPGYVPPVQHDRPNGPPPKPEDLWPEDYPEEARH